MGEKLVKLYDYTGVISNKDNWRAYFKEHYRELYDIWVPLTLKDKLTPQEEEIKKETKLIVTPLFEQASDNLSYKTEANPNVKLRLEEDRDLGYEVVIFTTSPIKTINQATQIMGIDRLVSEVISLSNLVEYSKISNLIKDDKRAFALAEEYNHKILGFGPIYSFVDDTPSVITSALNSQLSHSKPLFFLYDKKAQGTIQKEGFIIINDLINVK